MADIDSRAVTEVRIPASSLKTGDLVNTSPGRRRRLAGGRRRVRPAGRRTSGRAEDIRELLATLAGRYVLVELTDIAPVDANVYFADDSTAMLYASDDGADTRVADAVSTRGRRPDLPLHQVRAGQRPRRLTFGRTRPAGPTGRAGGWPGAGLVISQGCPRPAGRRPRRPGAGSGAGRSSAPPTGRGTPRHRPPIDEAFSPWRTSSPRSSASRRTRRRACATRA